MSKQRGVPGPIEQRLLEDLPCIRSPKLILPGSGVSIWSMGDDKMTFQATSADTDEVWQDYVRQLRQQAEMKDVTAATYRNAKAMSNAAPSIERRQIALAVCVALIAGYLDAYALRTLGIFVSFMSGNTTMAGLSTGERHFLSALAPALAIPSFVLGSFAGTWIMTYRERYPRRLLFLANAILLCAVHVLASHESLKMANIAVLSIATGLLNPALSRIGTESISITFVTGTLSRLGGHLARGVKGVSLHDAEGDWDNHFRRARLDLYLWAGFGIGAVLSGMLMTTFAQHFVLAIPIVVMLGFGIFARAADSCGPRAGGQKQGA